MIRNIMCIVIVFISNNLCGSEEELAKRIFALPKDIQFLIFECVKEENKKTIKAYVQKSIGIDKFYKDLYDVEHYFSFMNFGTKCTHIVAFYPKKGGGHDLGIEETAFGKLVKNAFACVFLHILKGEKMERMDLIEKPEQAPLFFDGICLSEKKPGRVAYLFQSSHHVEWPSQSSHQDPGMGWKGMNCVDTINHERKCFLL